MKHHAKLKSLYQSDGYQWYFKNAELLRKGKVNEADLENIAEELESMGRSEERELESYLTQLFLHLLKWKYQTGKRGKSWEISIKKQRMHFTKHLAKNPSLKGHLDEIVKNAYEYALLDAQEETGLPLEAFPKKMPFTLKESLTENWLPS